MGRKFIRPTIAACRVLPTDYKDYGGKVKRWADSKSAYPDCSSGCRFFKALHIAPGEVKELPQYTGEDFDYGVCLNPKSPRLGLLTFEHQAGKGCFKS